MNGNKIRAVTLAALMVLSVVALAAPASAAGSTEVSVSPSSQTVAPGNTVTYDLVVESADGGVGAYEYTINVSDTSAATITDFTAGGDPGSLTSNIASDGSGVSVEGALADTAQTGQVTIGTITVSGEAAGSADITANVPVLGDEDGSGYTVTAVNNGAVTVDSGSSGGGSGAPEYAGGAILYNDGGTSQIEVPFDAEVGDAANENDIVLLEDGDEVATSDYDVSEASTDGRVLITGPFVDSATASDDIEVDLNTDEFNNAGEKSVAFATAQTSFDRTGQFDSSDPPEFNVYQGATVAVYNAAGASDFTVEGDDTEYFQSYSSGTNSDVFFVQTDNLDLDTYNFNGEANFTVRNLELGVELDELNVSTEDNIEGDVSARASNRDVTIELLDDDGDTVDDGTIDTELGGQSDASFSYDVDGINLDTGEYTVQVTDDGSGVVIESSTITVSEEEDDDAEFSSNTYSEERGDIIETTVELEGTDFASITFGSDDDGVVANATVEDEDGDGEVTVYLNTFNALGGDVFYLDSDSDDGLTDQDISTSVDNLIDSGEYELEVTAGEEAYAEDADGVGTVVLDERSSESLRMWTGSSGEIDPSDLEDVNEALNNGEITQSSDIAVGDLAVHQLQASGFEGALNAQQDEDVTDAFLNLEEGDNVIDLTLEEADPGANQNAEELALGRNNVSVIADGPNDTYFVIVDTGAVNFADGDALPADDDTELEANFSVIDNDANAVGDFTPGNLDDDENEEVIVEFTAEEPEAAVDEPFNVSQASGQTISGTTNIAPGTELDLRVRSQSGVTPSFLKTASPVVQSDGTYSATFDFSEQNIGDEYDIVVANTLLADDEEESGTVVESVAEGTATATPEPDTATATPEPDTATPEPDTATPEPDTATPEPDTDTAMPDTDTPTSTPTSTPGFGVIVALAALIAAALLAIRRD